MRSDRSRRPEGHWATAAELAEFAYCPRAWHYRRDPPAEGATSASRISAEAGVRFHRRALSGEEARERRGGLYVALLLVALALMALAVAGALA